MPPDGGSAVTRLLLAARPPRHRDDPVAVCMEERGLTAAPEVVLAQRRVRVRPLA